MTRKWNVYVSRRLPQPAMDFLTERCSVECNPDDRGLTREEFLRVIAGRDAVLCQLSERIDAEAFTAAGANCKVFANYAVGYNNIDVGEATKRGVMITNTPDVLTHATSDMAWALLFAAARRVAEGDLLLRRHEAWNWAPEFMLGQDIYGKTLGVLGAGRIGMAFAKKSRGWDMKVIYNDIAPNPAFEKETGGTFVSKEDLLRSADFVSIHVPLLPETRHFIGAPEFDLMKRTAVLINTSRGPVVDEKELVKALREHKIFAAGLDVFEDEPRMAPGLDALPNVVICPHIASATIKSRTDMGLVAARNIVAAMNGETPPSLVNPEALENRGK
jgi:lactate dehydrogenase-like 2-hydroxyacid dehydrogenase